jgi:hypothetical protein
MTNNDEDKGWDTLAEEFGLEPGEAAPPPAKAETPPPPPRPARPAPAPRPARPEPKPEPEDEGDDFGGFVAEPPAPPAALYDPGPEEVVDEADDLEDADAGDDEGPEGEPGGDETEAGKKKRRRRRRRKKKGPDAPTVAGEPAGAGEAPAEDEVEEGEAPAEFEGDGENEPAQSAVDEEMDEEAAGPAPVWNVMTWTELVGKLYRPN